jgi:hypothetical protein
MTSKLPESGSKDETIDAGQPRKIVRDIFSGVELASSL